MEESINTNLSDYTLDELFALFDINITRDTTYEILKTELEDSATKYKTLFKNNSKLVYFFESAKNYLLQSNKPVNESIVIESAHAYKYGDIKYSEGNNDMFDSNNGAGNPIHRKTVTRLFNIDSRFRDNYNSSSSTNFTMKLQNYRNEIV